MLQIRFFFVLFIFFYYSTITWGKEQINKQNDELVFSIFPDKWPYSFIDKEGDFSGLSVDLSRALAKEMGYSCILKVVHRSDLAFRLKSKEIDVAADLFFREENEVFCQPVFNYIHYKTLLIIRKGTLFFSSLNEAESLDLSIVKDSWEYKYIKTYSDRKKFNYSIDYENCLRKVSQGKADFCFVPDYIADEYLNRREFARLNSYVFPFFLASMGGMAVSKDNAKLKHELIKALDTLKEKGRYQQIQRKWKQKRLFKKQTFLFIMYWPYFLILILITLFSLILLRRKKQKAIKTLSMQNEFLDLALQSIQSVVWSYFPQSKRRIVFQHSDAKIPYKKSPMEYLEGEEFLHNRDLLLSGKKDKWEGYVQAKKDPLGRSKYYLLNMRSLKNEKSEVTEILVLQIDVTDAKISDKMMLIKEKTEFSNYMKSSFLANMSSKIRTPLNSLMKYAQLVVEAEDKKDRELYAEQANEYASKILYVLDNIWSLFKQMDDVRSPVQVKRFDLSASLTQKINNEFVKGIIPIQIKKDFSQTPFWVKMNEDHVSQIYEIFISDALRHTSKEVIKVGFDSYKANYVRLYVSDTGVTRNDLDIFYDETKSEKVLFERLGSGLPIVNKIAKYYNGKLGVSSVAEKSCEFYVLLKVDYSDE